MVGGRRSSIALAVLAVAGALVAAQPTTPRAAAGRGCEQRLEARNVSYLPAAARPGVAQPVFVRMPLNGVSYFAAGEPRRQRRLFMDCKLALALHRAGETLTARGIRAVEHFGVYAYRCIAGTDPCKLSQHAHATAIDLHAFRGARGRNYNVESDWVIDHAGQSTCAAQTKGPKDALLHELACAWNESGLFNIILTPNYNADHRNHFHVDLTPQERYIN